MEQIRVFPFERWEKWEVLKSLSGPGIRLNASEFFAATQECHEFQNMFLASELRRRELVSCSEHTAFNEIQELQKLGIPIGIEFRYTEFAYEPYACVTGCWSQLETISNNREVDGNFVVNALRLSFVSEGVSK